MKDATSVDFEPQVEVIYRTEVELGGGQGVRCGSVSLKDPKVEFIGIVARDCPFRD